LAVALRAAAPLFALLLFVAPSAWAEAEPGGWSYDLAHELMSPYCPGRTLAECPSDKADTLRMWLHVQEASGRSQAEVTAELVERFGEQVLSAPRPEGFGLAAYFVPVLAFLAGGCLVWHFLRKQTREAAAAPRPAQAPAGPSDPELERLVDEDLSR
jgi:cytochrome c-type biogenesis protein CcmH